jgi:hypothetical protein
MDYEQALSRLKWAVDSRMYGQVDFLFSNGKLTLIRTTQTESPKTAEKGARDEQRTSR